jgi:hypothetical protein
MSNEEQKDMNANSELRKYFFETILLCALFALYLSLKDITNGTLFGLLRSLSVWFFLILFIMYVNKLIIRSILFKYNQSCSPSLVYAVLLPFIFSGLMAILVYFIDMFGRHTYTFGYKPLAWSLSISLIFAVLDVLKNKGEASREFVCMFISRSG